MTVSREEFLADLDMASDEIPEESAKMANSSTEDASAGDAPDVNAAIEALIFYIGTVVIAEKGIRDRRPVLDRVYLAGHGKVAFVFDLGAAVLEIPDDVPPDLAPAAKAILADLEGST